VIFDEVVTGFRIARGGAQERYGIAADITMLSKAIAGGVPLGAIGGRRDIMNLLVDGTVFHGGVYSGNPLCLAATVAVQRRYESNGSAIYGGLEEAGARLEHGLRVRLADAGIPAVVQRIGAMLSLWLTRGSAEAPGSYRDVVAMADHDAFVRLQQTAQRVGLYFHPNHFEPWYLSTTHTPAVIDEALGRFAQALEIFRFGDG
jgi:glutamate-1-semialdehyde 2,1-aminomutase